MRLSGDGGGESNFETTGARVAGVKAWFELRGLPVQASLRASGGDDQVSAIRAREQ